ncbi:dTMP kinase [soil metagenome]
MKRGLFIALDGLDGTGKSTQCKLLAEWLRSRGHSVVECVDPGGTDLGQRVRDLLLFGKSVQMNARTEALLFMASRAELVEQIIRPALDRGDIVISDRYVLASVVYQGYAGGLTPREVWALGEFTTRGVWPDLNIILDLAVAEALKRRGREADRMESKGVAFFEKVRQGFLTEANLKPDTVAIVDANTTIDEIQTAIRQRIESKIR